MSVGAKLILHAAIVRDVYRGWLINDSWFEAAKDPFCFVMDVQAIHQAALASSCSAAQRVEAQTFSCMRYTFLVILLLLPPRLEEGVLVS